VVEGITGMSVGEERAITTTVGDTWWEPKSLEGVQVCAYITLTELFEWELPEVTLQPPMLTLLSAAARSRGDFTGQNLSRLLDS
jgi:hypothetical protein